MSCIVYLFFQFMEFRRQRYDDDVTHIHVFAQVNEYYIVRLLIRCKAYHMMDAYLSCDDGVIWHFFHTRYVLPLVFSPTSTDKSWIWCLHWRNFHFASKESFCLSSFCSAQIHLSRLQPVEFSHQYNFHQHFQKQNIFFGRNSHHETNVVPFKPNDVSVIKWKWFHLKIKRFKYESPEFMTNLLFHRRKKPSINSFSFKINRNLWNFI